MRHAAALLLLTPFMLTGCIAAGVAAGTEAGVSLAEERTLGRKVDDTVIYSDINRLYIKEGTSDLFGGVTVDVRHARVMLTGNVETEATAQKAVALAWQARGVEEVLNEITVSPGSGFRVAATDTMIKKNLEARLLVTKHVWLINYSLNIVNGTAYLLGRVSDQAELDRVLSVTRSTKGVKRVVNYLQVRAQNDPVHPPASPYATPAPAATVPATSAPIYNDSIDTAPYAPGANSAPAAQATPYYSAPSTTAAPAVKDSGAYPPATSTPPANGAALPSVSF